MTSAHISSAAALHTNAHTADAATAAHGKFMRTRMCTHVSGADVRRGCSCGAAVSRCRPTDKGLLTQRRPLFAATHLCCCKTIRPLPSTTATGHDRGVPKPSQTERPQTGSEEELAKGSWLKASLLNAATEIRDCFTHRNW